MAYVPPHRASGSARNSCRSLADLAGRRPSNLGGDERNATDDVRPMRGNFRDFHAVIQASRYRVHAPNCSCRNRLLMSAKDKQEELVLEAGSLDGRDPFDNLVVVPDDRGWSSQRSDRATSTEINPPDVFICEGTGKRSFRGDAASCETKLARAIFGDEAQKRPFSYDETRTPSFEVTCARCLLASQRNGFVVIVARAFEEMEEMIQHGRNAARAKAQRRLLDASHYHFTIVLELSTLQALDGLVKDEREEAKMLVLAQIDDSNAEVPVEMFGAVGSKSSTLARLDGVAPRDLRITMGNNLQCLLSHARRRSAMFEKYIMVAGFVDGDAEFELGLPGGKRFLGESTMEDAVRKLEAECSLRIDNTWMSRRVQRKHGGCQKKGKGIDMILPVGRDASNAFFVMAPPRLSLHDVFLKIRGISSLGYYTLG